MVHSLAKVFSKRLILTFLLVGLLAGCSGLTEKILPQPKALPVSPTPTDPRIQAIESALQVVAAGREDVLAFLLYPIQLVRVDFAPDGSLALVWFTLLDPDTNEIIPGEPGLALAYPAGEENRQAWNISLQADPDWVEKLAQVPDSLLTPELKERYLPAVQQVPKDHKVFTGYRLPWPGGTARRVSGSIGHVLTYKTCPTTCLYAFDFADGTMFPVTAARGGRVKYAVWRWPNGNSKNANFLVIEDTSTAPTTYQVYYHLAQDSIPVELRVPGTPVYQGQFLGNADNTGPSTGHHLHFHVHTNSGYYWGSSVDIVFEDVSVNGGRPRTCVESSQFPDYGRQCQKGNWYTSGNYGDDEPPTGDLIEPAPGQKIESPILRIAGWGSDNKGVASMQVMVTWDGVWKALGPAQTTSPFNLDVNVCEAGIPDGPFMLALAVRDQAGRISQGMPGQRLLEKNYDCSPPPTPQPCLPGPQQIALYAGSDYSGVCRLFDIGDYLSADVIQAATGGSPVASVRIGTEVMAVFFNTDNLQGDYITLLSDDPDLSDNAMKENALASLSIQPRLPVPAPPLIVAPRNQADLPPSEQDKLVLSWKGDDVSREFRAELNGPGGFYRTIEWQQSQTWEVGLLPPGDYTLMLWARNPVGENRSSLKFSVAKAEPPPLARLEAASGKLETTAIQLRWQVEAGEKTIDHYEMEYRLDGGEWQTWTRPLSAATRQAWYIGLPGHRYEFRLRAVGLKGNAAPYSEQPEVILEISPDCQPDAFEGEDPGDDQFTGSSPIEPGETQEHNLCGLGDIDWIAFPAEAGVAYRITTEPVSGAAAVTVQLYAPDGYNLLGEARPEGLQQPAALEWVAPDNGIYFARLSPYDAGLAGSDVRYQVRVARLSQVFTPTLVCSTLFLPLIWMIVRTYLKAKKQPQR